MLRPDPDQLGNDVPAAYARLRIEIEAGSRLSIDEQDIGTAPFSDIFLAPGLHTFLAETPDGTIIEQLIDVSPDTRVVEF